MGTVPASDGGMGTGDLTDGPAHGGAGRDPQSIGIEGAIALARHRAAEEWVMAGGVAGGGRVTSPLSHRR
jgi:hypothetical protein